MHARTLHISIAVVASVAALVPAAVSCGGPQINVDQLAQSPGMHKTTPFSITVDGQSVSYKASTTEASYDASTHMLSLYIFGDDMADNDDLTHTTCDFASYSGPSGSYVIARFKDFDPGKSGTFTATDADVVTLNAGGPLTKKGALDGVTLAVTQNDDNRIVGTFSGGKASGSIDAWPCFVDGGAGGLPTPAPPAPADSAATATSSSAGPADAGAVADDASTAPPSKKKKKKKKSGG